MGCEHLTGKQELLSKLQQSQDEVRRLEDSSITQVKEEIGYEYSEVADTIAN